ncbi:hypothetical protein [Nonomuraea sp. B1E8]|uniref:hypothetical protein n=1 Tax=unclassified Nonomuraea TaxID=2593643 RepID=UPI00325EE810
MIAVVVSLVAVVLLVLVVVALGMRSMNRRESSLPPERLKEMAEKEESTHARSTDEFAAHEPRMNNFSPDFSPIDQPKAPKPVRTGQRGRRGVDEWGNPTSDDEDEEFWANIRSDAEEGGFGAGGTVAARKGASRPVERERPTERRAERRAESPAEPGGERPAERQSSRPAERRSERPGKRAAKPRPVAASVDPEATTVQGPLPQRQPAASSHSAPHSSGLADLVEPAKPAVPAQSELADQRTVTFSAPPGDVMSILAPGAQPVPPPARPADPAPSTPPVPVSSNTTYPAPTTSGSFPAAGGNGSLSTNSGGSFPATPAGGSGSFPAVSPTSSGNFPAARPAPIHGAPTSDPFPAYNGVADPLDTTWTNPPATGPSSGPSSGSPSGSWPASTPDALDGASPATSFGAVGSWPAFDQPAERAAYPASYEVSAGWAVADDSAPLTGPSPATGTPTAPGRTVPAYDDVLAAPTPAPAPAPQPSSFAYETGDITTSPGAWPEPSAGGVAASDTTWQAFGGDAQARPQAASGNGRGSHRRKSPEQDYPHDYYR